ncbi:hypothetical protein E4U26_008380, partial [Claviceps purpurea]
MGDHYEDPGAPVGTQERVVTRRLLSTSSRVRNPAAQIDAQEQFQANHGLLIQNEQSNGVELTLHFMESLALK